MPAMHQRLVLLGLALTANAHFVLQIPTSLGYNDELETTGPCDTFDPTDQSQGVTEWSVQGDSIGLLSTHPSVTWEINVALLSDTSNWRPLVQSFGQKGVGEVCFTKVPGFEAWVGKDAVLQLIQHAPDGKLYQCAAIKFVAGGPDSVPNDCTNSPGVSYDPIVAAPGPSSPTSSSPGGGHSQSITSSSTSGPAPTNTSPDTSSEPSSTGSGPGASTTSDLSSTGTHSGHTHPSGTAEGSTAVGGGSTVTGSATVSQPPVVTAGAGSLACGAGSMFALGVLAAGLLL